LRIRSFLWLQATSLVQLASAEIPLGTVEEAIRILELNYKADLGRGLRLQRHHGRFQLTTPPEFSFIIERFLGLEATSRLSRAALETLAIIAFQQPTTRPEIDVIRGVNSDSVLKNLLSKGLIQEIGRAEKPGRPVLFSTTSEFLQYFVKFLKSFSFV
jgi:segregation and condensation protein B